ncbi:hypothetical protein PMI04_008225 [Sphingobium sp. AP49]|uniref:hypothetical protein n=1 Tax=Sphingobium sp. AP49 TaxID=1144307 RepID=UPI00026ED1A2|nr:hypothetical protein [Sphingobium sp. AP49]WHO40567.1 hypothetical protein PMI04_008225 [Sphingobium sp. AP49]
MAIRRFLTVAAALGAAFAIPAIGTAAEWDEEQEQLYLSCVAKYVQYGMGTQSQAEQYCYGLYYGDETSGYPGKDPIKPHPGNPCYGSNQAGCAPN